MATDSTLHPSEAFWRLPAASVRELSRLEPWRAVAHVSAEWLAIAAAILLCERFWHPALYVAAVVWIGARQHALGLLAHDGAHRLLLRSRRWNDLVTELLCAWPVFMSLEAYRRIHVLHHQHLNTERDPDWARNRPDRLRTRRGSVELVRILLGLNPEQRELGKFFRASEGDAAGRGHAAARGIYYAAILGLLAWAGALQELVLYWAVPLFSWFLLTMRLKGVAEHFAVEGADAPSSSRTTELSWLARLLVAPKNVHYHAAHHLYPSVPFYRLPMLHALLMAQPGFRERAHLTHGYLAFLRECAAQAARASAREAAA